MNFTKGFTALELIMAILIMGILTFVAIQRSTAPEVCTAQAAYKIKSDIRYAQGFALATQKRTRVSFDAAGENYSVYCENSPGNWALLKEPSNQRNFIVNLVTGPYKGVDIVHTNFGGVNFGLVFDAAGRPYGYDPAGGAAIALSGQGTVTLNNGLTVTVEPQTGRASIA